MRNQKICKNKHFSETKKKAQTENIIWELDNQCANCLNEERKEQHTITQSNYRVKLHKLN